MKFKLILIHCPNEGLFCSYPTTFVGYSESEIECNMRTNTSFECEQVRDWLTTSSAYNEIEFNEALSKGNGFQDLIDLAKKWGWNVSITKGDIK